MSLDLPSLPPSGQGIKYVRAAWDVGRDGSGLTPAFPPGQGVPAGSLILGYAYRVVDTFVDTGTTTIMIVVSGQPIATALDPVAVPVASAFVAGATIVTFDGSTTPFVVATGDGYIAGSMLIYVFYV